MLRCRLTLKCTTSPFLRVRTSCARPPSHARSSDSYSAMPSSRVSRSPALTFSSSSRLSPTSMPAPLYDLPRRRQTMSSMTNRTPPPFGREVAPTGPGTRLHLFGKHPDPVLPLGGEHDG